MRHEDNESNVININEVDCIFCVPENGKVNAWDEIDKVLSAKKAQLSQEDGSSKKESSGRSPWSYKALRGSALGPTMSFLRAQNNF